MSKKRSKIGKKNAADVTGRSWASIKTLDAFHNALTRSGYGMPNALEATQYPLTRYTQNWQEINSMYRSHWVVQRLINVIPQDMIKNGYDIQSDLKPEQLKDIWSTIRKTRLHAKILEGLYWGRLYGGAAGIILLDNEGDKLEEPIDLDMIMPDSFKGLLIVDRWSGITPESDLVTDINDPEFGLPEYYRISLSDTGQGQRIHHSRVCRFVGREMPYLEKLAENYWGTSELEHVIEEIRKRDNVSWNIAVLTFMANLRILKIDGMEEILALGDKNAQQELYDTVEGMNMLLNNNALQVLGSKDDYQQHQYTFSGLGDVYDRFMMDVSGAAGIPVTKLFGRSPAGLNSTGDADLQNYYDTVEACQEAQLRPVLDKLLPIVFMSTLGAVPDDLDYTFNPVRRSGEDEKQDIGSKQTTAVIEAFTAGLISQQTALQELQQSSKRTGMWTNITDEQIADADDTTQMMGEEPPPGVSDDDLDAAQPGMSNTVMDADWDESKHKRDDDGTFAKMGGGESTDNDDNDDDVYSISNVLGPEYSGYKGNNAIDKLLKEKCGHINDAYYRDGLGGISVAWGDDGFGLQHIIKRRKENGFSDEKIHALLYQMRDVIERGDMVMSSRGNIDIKKDGQCVVVTPNLRGKKLTFILTSFRYRKKSKK